MIATLPADMTSVQNAGHRVVGRLWTRTPAPADKWIQLQLMDGTITYAAAGEFPGRTLDATVMLETTGIPSVTESISDTAVDWGHAPLSPFGSWVKAEQVVYRMDGTQIVVPWGVYRVDSIDIDELQATVKITASDASSQVEDRALVTLGQGHVTATDTIQSKMSRTLNDVFSGNITPFWSSLIDFAGLADRAFGGKGAQYGGTRLEMLGSLAVKLPGGSGWRLTCPREGPLFKLVKAGWSSPEAAYVTVAENLVFTDFSDRIDRDNLFNEVVVTYEYTKADGYGQNRTFQKRLLAQYTDAGEELAGSGPFGWVSQETVQIDIPAGEADPDGYARDKALEAIGTQFTASRTVTLSCGPIYGLEQGDPVYVQVEPDGPRRKGTLVGATIPLTAEGGPWQLTVAMVDALDPSWKPRYTLTTVSTKAEDNFTWKAMKAPSGVDLDTGQGSGKTKKLWRGWTVDHASKLVGGSSLTATSDGGQVVFRTGQAWSEGAAEHRYRVKASVTAAKGTLKARVGLDTNTQGVIWGEWKSFTQGKSQTVTIDTVRKVNPTAVTFGVRVETSGMSSGEQVRLNSVGVEQAVRNKT